MSSVGKAIGYLVGAFLAAVVLAAIVFAFFYFTNNFSMPSGAASSAVPLPF